MNIDPVTLLVVGLIAVAVVGYLLYVAHAFGAQKAQTQFVKLTNIIRTVVNQADAIGSMTNEQKYKFVSDEVSYTLDDWGWKVPPEVVRQMIEGAVDIIHKAQDKQVTQ